MTPKSKAKSNENISVREFYSTYKKQLKLTLVAGERGLRKLIREKSINRPSLALTGFFKSFATKRLQLFGAGEMAYLHNMSEAKQWKILDKIISMNLPCIVVSRQLVPTDALLRAAEAHNVPLMRTPMNSRDFTTMTTVLLEEWMAPHLTEHATLMDIKGIGTLIKGESGVGKSETALALVERGYSLVADDVVYIRLIGEHDLLGTSSELNRGYLECRGLGILNIAELFGIRAVQLEKRIDLVITFRDWEPGVDEDRTGLDQDYYEILGIDVPQVKLPVRPGRDLARLVEVAALVQALKLIGHDSAREFNERLIAHMAEKKDLNEDLTK